jgi:hypothetical protein
VDDRSRFACDRVTSRNRRERAREPAALPVFQNDDGVLEIESYGFKQLQNVEPDDTLGIEELEVSHNGV